MGIHTCNPRTWRLKQKDQELEVSQVPVAHACNPSYSGGRDQENYISEKKPSQKKADGVGQGVGPQYKPQYHKKKKKKKRELQASLRY
jgi:hypothetical protein